MTARRLFDFPGMGWRNPFAELDRMQREMDRLFGGKFFRAGLPELQAGVFPAVNVTEEKDHYYIRAELPGMAAEDLDIQAAGNSVSISGERKISGEGDNVRYHRREREAGRFSRVINLPEGANLEDVKAGLKNGVLTLTIGKSEASKPRQISIN